MSARAGGHGRIGCLLRVRALIALAALLALGCDAAPGEDGGAPDSAAPIDAATRTDGGAPDGAAPIDAATRTDGGAPADTGSPIDASPADAAALDATPAPDATPADASSPIDATTPIDATSPTDAAAPTDASSSMDATAPTDAASGDGGAIDAGSDAGAEEDGGPPIIPTELYPPRAYLEQGATQSDPTTAAPIVFDLTFDEPILASTLTTSDLEIEPAIPLTTAIVDSGDHRRFEVQLSDLPSVDQQYRVSLPYGRVTDPSGNPNEPSVSVDNGVFYDDPATSTVEVRQYPPLVPVTNTLPITFQIVFQAYAVLGFDVSDVVNGGTAPGVVWELETLNEGYLYLVRAVTVGGQGTVYPVVPAGATLTVGGVPNLESVYVGGPVTYTPLAILVVDDAVGSEGGSLAFTARFEGALRPSTETLFDWATEDGTGLAGVDYVARSVADQSIAASAFGTTFYVPARADDAVPALDKDFRVRIRNVRGDVFVADDVGVGTVRSDDRGTYYFGSNRGSNPQAGGTDLFLTGTTIISFGHHPDYGLSLRRQDLFTAGLSRTLTVDGSSPGGLAPSDDGYFYVSNEYGSFTIRRYEYSTDSGDWAFGDYGDLEVADPTDELESMDVAVDAAQLYVIGQRTTPGGDSAWFLEARDEATGAPSATFGTAGRLVLDRVAGAGVEAPVTAQTDGASLYVLGSIDGVYRIEKRSVIDGALDAGFGTGGVLELTSYTRVADLALEDGYLFVVGVEPGGSTLEQFDAVDGAPGWVRGTLMDDPRSITATDHGLYLGGSRDEAMHLERWGLDGVPRWVRSAEADKAPAGIGDIAYQAGSPWIHSVGYHSWNGYRDWYYDRRSREDGFRHTHAVGAPPE